MINEIAVNLATVFVKLLVAANTTLPVKKGIKIILAFNKQLLSQIHVMHWVDNQDLSNSKCLTVFPYPPKSLHSLHLSFLFSTVLHELFFQTQILYSPFSLGFTLWLSWREFAYNAGDLGSVPGLERPPGEGNPLQYSGLENSTDCIVHGVTKSRT